MKNMFEQKCELSLLYFLIFFYLRIASNFLKNTWFPPIHLNCRRQKRYSKKCYLRVVSFFLGGDDENLGQSFTWQTGHE